MLQIIVRALSEALEWMHTGRRDIGLTVAGLFIGFVIVWRYRGWIELKKHAAETIFTVVAPSMAIWLCVFFCFVFYEVPKEIRTAAASVGVPNWPAPKPPAFAFEGRARATRTLVPRTYIEFGRFWSPYDSQFVPAAGWPLRINVAFTNKGGVSADIWRPLGTVYLRNDPSLANQEDVVAKFTHEVWRNFPRPPQPATMIPGESKFFTAQGEQPQLPEANTLGFPGRVEIMFIVAEVEFHDPAGMNHARYCGWGTLSAAKSWIDQPPVSVWNECKVFNKGD